MRLNQEFRASYFSKVYLHLFSIRGPKSVPLAASWFWFDELTNETLCKQMLVSETRGLRSNVFMALSESPTLDHVLTITSAGNPDDEDTFYVVFVAHGQAIWFAESVSTTSNFTRLDLEQFGASQIHNPLARNLVRPRSICHFCNRPNQPPDCARLSFYFWHSDPEPFIEKGALCEGCFVRCSRGGWANPNPMLGPEEECNLHIVARGPRWIDCVWKPKHIRGREAYQYEMALYLNHTGMADMWQIPEVKLCVRSRDTQEESSVGMTRKMQSMKNDSDLFILQNFVLLATSLQPELDTVLPRQFSELPQPEADDTFFVLLALNGHLLWYAESLAKPLRLDAIVPLLSKMVKRGGPKYSLDL